MISDTVPEFIPGLELSEKFYFEAAKPIIDAHFSDLSYSAALIGYGSEVLGFDTPISRDHHWGPRFLMFLPEENFTDTKARVDEALRTNLPHEFRGYPTNYSNGDQIGIRRAAPIAEGPVNHFVEFYTVRSFFADRLRIDPYAEMRPRDWVTIPQQRLLEIVNGKVFWDGLNELRSMQEKLSYYPRDIWLYLMATQWNKIAQFEAFVGRAGESGDELGSRIIAAKIVYYAAHLCFLLERKYAPYAKLFGAGFKRLQSSAIMSPLFMQVLNTKTWEEREQYLSNVYTELAKMHNTLELTPFINEEVTDYYGRPYRVIHAGRFSDELDKLIVDQEVQFLPQFAGSIDQLIDQPDPLFNTDMQSKIKEAYNWQK